MTYNELVTMIEDYVGWDCNGLIPSIVTLAESRINRDCKLRSQEKIVVLSNDGNRIPLPQDFLSMREILEFPSNNLEYVAPDIFTGHRGRTGRPLVYTVIGNSVYLAPQPDNAGQYELAYYAALTPLSLAVQSNAVLSRFPDLYLYAALAESTMYNRSSVPAESWISAYNAAKESINKVESQARFGKSIAAKAPRI